MNIPTINSAYHFRMQSERKQTLVITPLVLVTTPEREDASCCQSVLIGNLLPGVINGLSSSLTTFNYINPHPFHKGVDCSICHPWYKFLK